MSEAPGYTKGQQWGALKKAWKGYRIAKAQHNQDDMLAYAKKIRSACKQIGIDVPKFPELGLDP